MHNVTNNKRKREKERDRSICLLYTILMNTYINKKKYLKKQRFFSKLIYLFLTICLMWKKWRKLICGKKCHISTMRSDMSKWWITCDSRYFHGLLSPDRCLTWQRIDFQDFNLSIKKMENLQEFQINYQKLLFNFN